MGRACIIVTICCLGRIFRSKKELNWCSEDTLVKVNVNNPFVAVNNNIRIKPLTILIYYASRVLWTFCLSGVTTSSFGVVCCNSVNFSLAEFFAWPTLSDNADLIFLGFRYLPPTKLRYANLKQYQTERGEENDLKDIVFR